MKYLSELVRIYFRVSSRTYIVIRNSSNIIKAKSISEERGA